MESKRKNTIKGESEDSEPTSSSLESGQQNKIENQRKILKDSKEMLGSCLTEIFQDCEEINRNLKENKESQVFEAERVEQNTSKERSVNSKSIISSKSKGTETDKKARKEVETESDKARVTYSIKSESKRKKRKVDQSKEEKEIQKGSKIGVPQSSSKNNVELDKVESVS